MPGPLTKEQVRQIQAIVGRLGAQIQNKQAAEQAVDTAQREADGLVGIPNPEAVIEQSSELLQQAYAEWLQTAAAPPRGGPARGVGGGPGAPGAPGAPGRGVTAAGIPAGAAGLAAQFGVPAEELQEPAEVARPRAGVISPTSQGEALVASALERQGISVDKNELRDLFQRINRQFVQAFQAGDYKADEFPSFLSSLEEPRLTQPVGGYTPEMLAGEEQIPGFAQGFARQLPQMRPAPALGERLDLQDLVEQYRYERQEAFREKAAERTPALAAQIDARMQRVQKKSFTRGLKDLAQRFPSSADLIEEYSDELWEMYEEFNERQKNQPIEGFADILGYETGGGPIPDVDPKFYFGNLDEKDLAKFFASNPRAKVAWEQSRTQDMFKSQFADPIRKLAKTPEEQLAAERQLRDMSRALPLLQKRFALAAQDDPSLTMDKFLESREARELIGHYTMEGQREQQAQEQKARGLAGELAWAGYSVQEIAQQMNLPLNVAVDYAKNGLQLRQREVAKATIALPTDLTGPEAAKAISERNASLDVLSGGLWGQAEQERIAAESQFASTRAQAEAREAIKGTAVYNVKDFQGRIAKQPLAEQKLAQEMLNNPGFQPFIDQFMALKGEQVQGQQAELERRYGGQLRVGAIPFGNREQMVRGFINDIIPSYQKFQEGQKANLETLQKRVASARSIGEQNQARMDLAEYQRKIAPPPEKNPYAGTDFIDAEVRWAAEHDQPNPYPNAPGLKEIYAGAFKGPTTSANYPAVQEVVTRQQEALKAQNAAQAQANALRLADMQRRAGVIQQPPGARQPGGGPVVAGGPAPTAGPGLAQAPAAAPGGKPPFEQWLPAALGATPETPDLRARLQAQYNSLSEADVRRHLGLSAAAPAPVGRAFGGGPVGAGPVRVDAQGNVIEDLGTPSLGQVRGGREFKGGPAGTGREFGGGPVGAGPVRVDEQGNVIEDLGTPGLRGGGRAFEGGPVGAGIGRTFMGGPATDVVGRAMKDTEFTPELSQFIAQNRQNVGNAFETADQVATRLAPQISEKYSAYQAKKTKPPVSTFEPGGGQESIQPVPQKKVEPSGRQFKGPPVEVFDYQGP